MLFLVFEVNLVGSTMLSSNLSASRLPVTSRKASCGVTVPIPFGA